MALRFVYAQAIGERLCMVRQRAKESWKIIKKTANNGPVLVVFHGVLLRYFVNRILREGNYRKIRPVELALASINELKIHPLGKVEILRLNDVNHLNG